SSLQWLFGSSGSPVRRHRFRIAEPMVELRSRRRPSYAPQGAHLTAVAETQSQSASAAASTVGSLDGGVIGQSSSVGTVRPVWGTPMSWNSSSVSCAPAWQLLHDALPTNRRAPLFAAGGIKFESGPAVTQRSKSESTLTSWYS